jgi:hypothetical protein
MERLKIYGGSVPKDEPRELLGSGLKDSTSLIILKPNPGIFHHTQDDIYISLSK